MNLAGDLIIATPQLDQTQFSQAVVLIVQQNETGTFGVMLNRPANEQVKRLWRTISGHTNARAERNISLGGPLSGPVFALHQDIACSEQKVECGLYFATTPQNLKKLVAESTLPYKIFFGAVAWQNGQLEKEIDSGVWFSCVGSKELIFADSEFQWELAVRNYGRRLWEFLGITNLPRNPEWN
jgi:putative transcriptional regulator